MYCSDIGNDIWQDQTSFSVLVDYHKTASESKVTNNSITIPSGPAVLKQYQINYNSSCIHYSRSLSNNCHRPIMRKKSA